MNLNMNYLNIKLGVDRKIFNKEETECLLILYNAFSFIFNTQNMNLNCLNR